MELETKTIITNRFKSLLWRASGFAFVAVAAYVLKVGDIFTLDYKMMINLGVLAFLGLVVGEVTKYLNS